MIHFHLYLASSSRMGGTHYDKSFLFVCCWCSSFRLCMYLQCSGEWHILECGAKDNVGFLLRTVEFMMHACMRSNDNLEKHSALHMSGSG